MKKLVFTRHAQDVAAERDLDPSWVELTIREPEWTKSDAHRPGVDLHFRPIPEHKNRILRVACFETDVEIRILTAFFDRDARKNR